MTGSELRDWAQEWRTTPPAPHHISGDTLHRRSVSTMCFLRHVCCMKCSIAHNAKVGSISKQKVAKATCLFHPADPAPSRKVLTQSPHPTSAPKCTIQKDSTHIPKLWPSHLTLHPPPDFSQGFSQGFSRGSFGAVLGHVLGCGLGFSGRCIWGRM